MITPLEAARQLAGWGFVVLPAKFRTKAPTVAWEAFQTAPPDAAQMEAWFADLTLSNFWILCGRPSSIVVLDCDSKATIEWAKRTIGEQILASTPSVKTTKGMHYYFRLGADEQVRQWSYHHEGLDLDVRSDGGGVIAPPSLHQSGAAYVWRHTPDEGWQPVPEALKQPLAAQEGAQEPANPDAERTTLAALLASPAPEGGRNEWLTSVAGHYAKQIPFRDGYMESVRLANSVLSPPLADREWRKTATSVWKAEHRTEPDAPRSWQPDLYTDAGNARRFADSYAGAVLYVEGHSWRCYEPTRGCYRPSESPVVQHALQITEQIYDEARRAQDTKTKSRINKWGDYSSSTRGVKALLELARTDPRLAASVDDFDADPMLVNVPNGVVDLHSGELLDHSPQYRMTKHTGAVYDVSAQAPLWHGHLERIFAGDHSMIDFFQRLAGYALTGHSTEQKLAILHGYGANGKSVTVETLRNVLGSYAETTDFKTFSVTRSDGPRNDLARLAGSRFVTASETNSRQWLDEAVVKQVTGGEPITARFLHREFFTYNPQFTVFLSTNHRPNIEGVDRGLWRRILLIPFDVTIEECEQDPHLTAKLRAEASGILNWLIVGCMAWQQQGLDPPVGVQLATAEYREESDTVGQFMQECLICGEDEWVELSDVHERYLMWSSSNGYQKMSRQAMSNRLREHGVTLTKDAPGSHRSRLRGHTLVSLGPLFQRADLA